MYGREKCRLELVQNGSLQEVGFEEVRHGFGVSLASELVVQSGDIVASRGNIRSRVCGTNVGDGTFASVTSRGDAEAHVSELSATAGGGDGGEVGNGLLTEHLDVRVGRVTSDWRQGGIREVCFLVVGGFHVAGHDVGDNATKV